MGLILELAGVIGGGAVAGGDGDGCIPGGANRRGQDVSQRAKGQSLHLDLNHAPIRFVCC